MISGSCLDLHRQRNLRVQIGVRKMTTRRDIERRRRTLERGGVEQVRGVEEIGLELALPLEPCLLAWVKHRVLVVLRIAVARSEPGPPRGLFLGEFLFERPLLLGRRCCYSRG